jgi:hypothetical protein
VFCCAFSGCYNLFLIGLKVSCLLLLSFACMLSFVLLYGTPALIGFVLQKIWMNQTWIPDELMHPAPRGWEPDWLEAQLFGFLWAVLFWIIPLTHKVNLDLGQSHQSEHHFYRTNLSHLGLVILTGEIFPFCSLLIRPYEENFDSHFCSVGGMCLERKHQRM